MSVFKLMAMAEIVKDASSKMCEVIVAKPNELQFDLDSNEAYETWLYFYNIKLCHHFGNTELPILEWRSKSGNRHVVVTLPKELSIPERIALQAMGGSDYGREFASLNCHWAGSEHPILLFKPFPKLLTSGDANAES